MSSIRVLGAFGGKSEKGGSSAFYLNEKHLIDAGNILEPLKEKNASIEKIWITHSHLDHIIDIAYILDLYYEQRKTPLILCGLPQTLKTIEKHFFNNAIWPDFSKISLHQSKEMCLKYAPLSLEKSYDIGEGMTIEAFPTDHTVPSCGYIVTKEEKSILISADTHSLDAVIALVKKNPSLKTIVIECSFPSALEDLAKVSKHLTPKLLFEKLAPLEQYGLHLKINHMKPAYLDTLTLEIEAKKGTWDVELLIDGNKIFF